MPHARVSLPCPFATRLPRPVIATRADAVALLPLPFLTVPSSKARTRGRGVRHWLLAGPGDQIQTGGSSPRPTGADDTTESGQVKRKVARLRALRQPF